MPNLPISGLPSLATPEPSDVFAIVNGGVTKKTTVQSVGDAVFNQISSSVVLTSQSSSFTTNTTFNSFTASYNNATGSFGVTSYYGSFFHTASMTNPAPNAYNSMSLNTTDFAYGVSISGSNNDKIKIANPGIYDIQFSAQMDKTNPGADFIAYIWLRKNGIDVPISNTGVTVLGGSNAKTVAAWNFFVSASTNDYYQLMWASSEIDARIQYATSSLGPAVPSLIVTVDRVA